MKLEPAAPAAPKKYGTKLVHPGIDIVYDHCPACDFPEAEGGYCPDCGWTLWNGRPRRVEKPKS